MEASPKLVIQRPPERTVGWPPGIFNGRRRDVAMHQEKGEISILIRAEPPLGSDFAPLHARREQIPSN